MNNANRKRLRKGEPLVYKGLQHNNNAVIIAYSVKRNYYKYLEELNYKTISILKKLYLKAVKTIRKTCPGVSCDDKRIISLFALNISNEGGF
jgi:hypothetical protein